MTFLLRAIGWAETLGLALAGICLFALFGLGAGEILLRQLAGRGLSFSVEYAGYLTALTFVLGLGATLSRGGHIQLTLLLEHLPQRGRTALDMIATALALVLAIIMTIAMADWAIGSFLRDARSYFTSQTPLGWPQACFAFGFFVLSLSLIGRLLRVSQGGKS